MDRCFGRLGAFENPAGIDAGLMIGVRNARPIAHEAARDDRFPKTVNRRYTVACGKFSKLACPAVEVGVDRHKQHTVSKLADGRKGILEVAVVLLAIAVVLKVRKHLAGVAGDKG